MKTKNSYIIAVLLWHLLFFFSLPSAAQVAGGEVIRRPKAKPKKEAKATTKKQKTSTRRADNSTTKKSETAPRSTAVTLSAAERQDILANLMDNMIDVKGGTFLMGSPDSLQGASTDERPARFVTVNDFRIGRFEVTQEEWMAVMGDNPSAFVGRARPVEQVSWNDCQRFIERLSKLMGVEFSLPTEAQWEYAARGGEQSETSSVQEDRTYMEAHAWFKSNATDETHDVGTKQPNALGLYDMNGNVWEWCADWYQEDAYASLPALNPVGPRQGTTRVNRGGCWQTPWSRCRFAFRGNDNPDDKYDVLGFRLVINNIQP